MDDREPGVTLLSGLGKDDVDFFQASVTGLGIEEEDDWYDAEIAGGFISTEVV